MEKESLPLEINKSNKLYFTNELILKTFYSEIIPICTTTSLLAPINRLKICCQNMKMISLIESEKVYSPYFLGKKIIKEQGIPAMWRGNVSIIYKQFMAFYSNLFIYSQLTTRDKNLSTMSKYFYMLISSTFSSLFYYPFEMINTRFCGDMTRFGHKKLYSSVGSAIIRCLDQESNFFNCLGSKFIFNNIYKGFGVHIVSNSLYYFIILNSYENLKKIVDNRDLNNVELYYKIYSVFGSTILSSFIASLILYPLDTLKKNLQVSGSLGYNHEYSQLNYIEILKKYKSEGIKHMYNGFLLNMINVISFPIILFIIKGSSINYNIV